jgi:hypothetical protein
MRIVAVKFSANGTKKGTVRAEKDDGEFLGFEDQVNLSVHKEQVRLKNSLKSVFAGEYAAELAQDPDYFNRKVSDLAIEVDKIANQQREEQERGERNPPHQQPVC